MASFRVVPQQMTREEWLSAAIDRVRPLFAAANHPVPDTVRASCGWPVGKALRSGKGGSRTIGQCWASAAAGDGTRHLFVSPCLTDSIEVLAVLVHELVHAVLDCAHGHDAPFKRIALKVGLQGKMTNTTAGPELTERLNAIVDSIGSYPHAGLDAMQQKTKTQSTRLLKVICPDCDYTVRTTAKWLEVGVPTCACGTEMEVAQ